MSKTRAVLTQEQNIEYWKERIGDKILSMSKQFELDMKVIISNMNHVKLDTLELRKVFAQLGETLLSLNKGVKEAITVEEAEKKRKEKAKKVEAKAAVAKKTEAVATEAK